jgi:hypothetical protein
MTATKYTPGPWAQSHRRGEDGMYQTQVYCAKGETIATVAWYPMPADADGSVGTYREGNARLIAASPALLEALRKAVLALAHASEEKPGLYRDAYESVDAAIALATGDAE